MVRAKFQVTKFAKMAYGDPAVFADSVEITLTPQYDQSIPEDEGFSKATPSGEIKLYVNNPPAIEALALGKFFYVDFTEVPQ
jgi:hypothetical protein